MRDPKLKEIKPFKGGIFAGVLNEIVAAVNALVRWTKPTAAGAAGGAGEKVKIQVVVQEFKPDPETGIIREWAVPREITVNKAVLGAIIDPSNP